jgi:trimeric autotransporter adhesin
VASAPSPASRSPETANQSSAHGTSQPAVDVTALTTRDDFLLELGQALDGQAAIRPVDSLDAALEGLGSGKRAQLLVIDARAVANVRAAVDAAATRAPRVLALVCAESSTERATSAALKGSRVFAVLSLPFEARKTRAVFEGAIAEATAARTAAASARAATQTFAEPLRPEPAAAHAEEPPGAAGSRTKLLLLAGAALALVAAAGGYWYFTQSAAPAPRAAKPASATPAAAAAPADSAPAAEGAAALPEAQTESLLHGKVDELLEKARAAMHERHFTEPAGDNALLYYRSAAAADPANGEAQDGLQRVAAVLAGRFEDALSGARFDEAAQTLANFKAATPADARVASFEQRLFAAEISKALADGNLERAAALVRQASAAGSTSPEQLAKWRADIAHRSEDAKVTRLAGLVEDRIRDGKLSEPDDSAKSYLQQLLTLAAANANTQRVQRELGNAYLRKAREAALSKNAVDEERWLNEARAIGMKQADISAFQRDVSNARAKVAAAESERTLQQARDRMRDGRLSEPAQDCAVFYLTQLQGSDPGNAGLADASHELSGKLLERARTSIAAGKPGDADLALARRFGADPKDVAAVQALASAPKSAAVDTAALAANLKRIRAVPPDYPPSAQAAHIAGAVTLTFTVDVNGETRDIRVVEATPPGVFDRAAIAAIKRWKYAPTLVNGTPVEVPVRTLVRFELPK